MEEGLHGHTEALDASVQAVEALLELASGRAGPHRIPRELMAPRAGLQGQKTHGEAGMFAHHIQ